MKTIIIYFGTFVRNMKSQSIGRTLLLHERCKKCGIPKKKPITYNTVSSVIGPQMKKPADIPVDTGTPYSNSKKNKAVLEHKIDYFTSSNKDFNI